MAETCRTCHAPIRWAFTEKGRRMPVDPEPHPEGTIALEPIPGASRDVTTMRAIVVAIGSRPTLYRSHFSTCPQADRHRKRGRR